MGHGFEHHDQIITYMGKTFRPGPFVEDAAYPTHINPVCWLNRRSISNVRNYLPICAWEWHTHHPRADAQDAEYKRRDRYSQGGADQAGLPIVTR